MDQNFTGLYGASMASVNLEHAMVTMVTMVHCFSAKMLFFQ